MARVQSRRASNGTTPMTSVLYDVIRFGRPFLTVFGKIEPKNVVSHHVDPKKALPYVTMRVLSHCASKSWSLQ